MNKTVKNIIALGMTMVIGMGLGFGLCHYKTINNNNNKIKVESIVNKNDGSKLINYSNGSFAVINEQKNQYEFTPSEMGDYDYNFNNKKDLDNAIATYTSIKNNGSY